MKKKFLSLIFGCSMLLVTTVNLKAQEAMLAEVKMFAGNFAPRGWAFCEGQLLPIAQYSALFSLLGTLYGGDGRTTFALPDMRGRVPVGVGNGPGLSSVKQGQKMGVETVTITNLNLPYGSDKVSGLSEKQISIEEGDSNQNVLVTSGTPGSKEVNTIKTNPTGGGQSINNVQPSIGIRYIIALQGIFPSRN